MYHGDTAKIEYHSNFVVIFPPKVWRKSQLFAAFPAGTIYYCCWIAAAGSQYILFLSVHFARRQAPRSNLLYFRVPACFPLDAAVDENDLIGLAQASGPSLLAIAPAALAAAPNALPLLGAALAIPAEALFIAALGSVGAGEAWFYRGGGGEGYPWFACSICWTLDDVSSGGWRFDSIRTISDGRLPRRVRGGRDGL